MLVGMISTLREGHWLSDYTIRLIEELDDNRDVFVRPLVDTCGYVDKNEHIFDGAWENIEQMSQSCDFLHLQWLDGLYSDEFIDRLVALDKPLVATLHDSLVPSNLAKKLSGTLVTNRNISHDCGIEFTRQHGTHFALNGEKYHEPPITSEMTVLILGEHCDVETVETACALANDELEDHILLCKRYTTDHYDYGELIDKIISAHIVVMLYPYDNGSRVAYRAYNVMDCGRPMIVSRNEWFYRIPSTVSMADDTTELADCLVDMATFYGEYLEEASKRFKGPTMIPSTWKDVADSYTAAYENIFSH